jgi:hypothetical protein
LAFKLPKWNDDWFERPEENCDWLREPEWKIELQLATLPIRDFVAMTMGCRYDLLDEEDPFQVIDLSPEGRGEVRREACDRLRVIVNNVEAGIFPGFERDGKKYCRLRDSTQWVHDHGWELPTPMLNLINIYPQQTPALPETPTTVSKWRKAFEYESEGLNALYDLIERYFFDIDGKPIYDSRKWPIKKTLPCPPDWSPRTRDEADTIITSGKRKGKAAK